MSSGPVTGVEPAVGAARATWWYRLRRPMLALAAGLSMAAAFPEPGWSYLAPVSVALFTLACWRARLRVGFGCGLLSGVAFYLVLLSWLRVIGVDAWLLLSVLWSLWLALLGLATALVASRLRWWPIAVAALWVLQEAVRDRVPWGGFPWGRLAFSQPESSVTPLAALGGAPLVTFAVALVGALLASAVLSLRARGWTAGAVAAAVAVLVTVVGLAVPLPAAGQPSPAEARLAVVQGSVPQPGLDFNSRRRAVLENHVSETMLLADKVRRGEVPQPDAVIWPENSSDVDPYADVAAAKRIAAAADAIGVPILVGAVVTVPTDVSKLWNIGIVWDPTTGPGDVYIKRHPVPFGEYLPGREVLGGLVDRFQRIPRDFQGSDDPGVLQLGPARIADVICFEIAYDSIVRDAVRAGGRVLVVQTNNATYGGTAQPAQQVAMSQLRAVEHGRGVLVAATSGISAVMSADGSLVARLPENVPGSIVQQVPLRDTLTIADRLGFWPELLGCMAALVALVLAARRLAGDRRRRRSG